MKQGFYQHEYTWSNHCITGNTLGWGITASSIPQSKTMLAELEKMASTAEPDRAGQIPLEELRYSPATGFVRLKTLPAGQGEDGRNHKLVYLLQVTDPGLRDPSAYFAGLKDWELTGSAQGNGQLAKLSFDPFGEPVDDILKEMNLYDRLPVFLKAVFWCLLEYSGGLNIVAAAWDKEEFGYQSGRFMYALHSLLPEALRTRAGYRSYAWEECEGAAFYFSPETVGSACFHLDERAYDRQDKEADELENYFYETLAACWKEERDNYIKIMGELSSYLDGSAGRANVLKKLQWIFWDYIRRHKTETAYGRTLSVDYLIQALPQLIYWSNQDDRLETVTKNCIHSLHRNRLSPDQCKDYLKALLGRVSKSSLKMICKEILWVLSRMKDHDTGLAVEGLTEVWEQNKSIYHVLRRSLLKDDAWTEAFDKMEYLGYGDIIEEQEKEAAQRGSRESEADIPFDDPATADEVLPISPGGDEEVSEDAHYRAIEEDDERAKGSFADFLLTGLPIGFLTGCILFLSHYSLMIGHWKIAVGMGGMWILLIMNHIYLLISRRQKNPLWQSIGFCLLEGFLIETAASMIINQKLRLYFFIILGVIVVLVQLVNIIRGLREERR